MIFGDYDADRFPDIYVSNLDGDESSLSQQSRRHLHRRGALPRRHPSSVSFPTWFWDYNNDGVLDIYVAAYDALIEDLAASYLGLETDAERACLYEGDGKGGFRDVTRERNLMRPSAPMGANFGDLDNDGYLDFYLGTGYPPYFALMPNLMYRNRSGETLRRRDHRRRLRKPAERACRGLRRLRSRRRSGRLRADGRSPRRRSLLQHASIATRDSATAGSWSSSPESSRTGPPSGPGFGCRCAEAGASRSVYKWVNSGGSFGANPLEQTIGLGKAERVELLEILLAHVRCYSDVRTGADGTIRPHSGGIGALHHPLMPRNRPTLSRLATH